MRAELATFAATPDRANEDFAAMNLSDDHGALVVLDGVGSSGKGCRHGVRWFTVRLGTTLLKLASTRRGHSLSTCLALAMERTANSHRASCDLSHTYTPQSTVVIARWRSEVIEHLVLSDSILLLHMVDGTVRPVQDLIRDRVSPRLSARLRAMRHAAVTLPPYSAEHTAADRQYRAIGHALRNSDGGFFTAAADPSVADRALTGTTPLADLRAVAALTDGAGRWVDPLGLGSWSGCVELLHEEGPRGLIARVRAAESTGPGELANPYEKPRDDASAVFVSFEVGT